MHSEMSGKTIYRGAEEQRPSAAVDVQVSMAQGELNITCSKTSAAEKERAREM